MSTRSEKFAYIKNRLAELGYYTDTWDGQEISFNQNKTFPAIFISYFGKKCQENQQVPDAVIDVAYIYFIYVTTTDYNVALDILDAIDGKLNGWILPDGSGKVDNYRQLEYGTSELLLEAHSDKYLFLKAFQIEDVEDY